jgi:DNA-binding transcriptional ArsR family regulator
VQTKEQLIVSDNCVDMDTEQLEQARASLPDLTTAADLAQIFQVLSDPTRVRIIALLADRELCVHAIAATLEMNQSAISHQLRTMRVMQLVRSRKEGRHVYYRLDDQHITTLFKQGLAHVQHRDLAGSRQS